jgi:hypothetical protein
MLASEKGAQPKKTLSLFQNESIKVSAYKSLESGNASAASTLLSTVVIGNAAEKEFKEAT